MMKQVSAQKAAHGSPSTEQLDMSRSNSFMMKTPKEPNRPFLSKGSKAFLSPDNSEAQLPTIAKGVRLSPSLTDPSDALPPVGTFMLSPNMSALQVDLDLGFDEMEMKNKSFVKNVMNSWYVGCVQEPHLYQDRHDTQAASALMIESPCEQFSTNHLHSFQTIKKPGHESTKRNSFMNAKFSLPEILSPIRNQNKSTL